MKKKKPAGEKQTIGIDLGDRQHHACARGGKPAKKRAVIAVARKLAVTLLALWKTGADYRPLPLATPPEAPHPPAFPSQLRSHPLATAIWRQREPHRSTR